MRVILDIETDALVNPSVIHCVVTRDIDTGIVSTFVGDEINGENLGSLLRQCDLVVGHNILLYDGPILGRLAGIHIDVDRIRDTLVLSHLFNYGLNAGHSLESWGKRFGIEKQGLDLDFRQFSEAMLKRCIVDTEINLKLWQFLEKKLILREDKAFDKAIPVEHAMVLICEDMQRNGFKYDKARADILRAELCEKIEALDRDIQASFSPKTVVEQLKTKVKTTIVPFNPNSPKQVIDRLWDAKWKPFEKTDGHLENRNPARKEHFLRYGWKINEANLATLPETAPKGAFLLVERILLESRRRKLDEWAGAYNPTTGRIHGRFRSIGTAPHRMSHQSPNMGNVATKKSIKFKTPHLREMAMHYGGVMRALWICDDDAYLVGTDMEGAHLRLFAHFINDQSFIEALVHGDKKKGTDPHTLNKNILGDICADRDIAKTFIFSWLNGAGGPKIAETFGCSLKDAKAALGTFTEAYPGLRTLKKKSIPKYAERGFFQGLDGRLVVCNSAHLMLAWMLQCGEAEVMKYANVLWRKELDKRGIRYKQVNFVHDEFVTEVWGGRDVADEVGRLQSEAIRQAGIVYNLHCPLAGEYKVGKNWLEVH